MCLNSIQLKCVCSELAQMQLMLNDQIPSPFIPIRITFKSILYLIYACVMCMPTSSTFSSQSSLCTCTKEKEEEQKKIASIELPFSTGSLTRNTYSINQYSQHLIIIFFAFFLSPLLSLLLLLHSGCVT